MAAELSHLKPGTVACLDLVGGSAERRAFFVEARRVFGLAAYSMPVF
jgi:hypothetical protein